MESGIKSLSEFISLIKRDNSKLYIPNLQRDYVWGKTEWKRLWDDIVNILSKMTNQNPGKKDECPQHFTGTLTLQNQGNNTYHLLDGQQRLTTILVLLDYLNYNLKSNELSWDFFNSKVKTVEIKMEEGLEKGKDKYTEIYRFFMDCHYEMNYQYTSELLDIVNNRLFFLVHVADESENAHEIFEGLNATGKNLEFSDLILNSLLEKGEGINSNTIKQEWEELLGMICGIKDISFLNEDGEEEIEEIVDSSPLKLKKFFNALNSMTLGENRSIQETVSDFNCMVERLGDFDILSNEIHLSTNVIQTLKKWANIYSIVVNPTEKLDVIKEKAYAKELYYLSIWNATSYIPTIMRIVYRNFYCDVSDTYPDNTVKNMLKVILSMVVNTRIILNRIHSDDKNMENKVRLIDLIFDSLKKLEQGKIQYDEDVVSIVCGNESIVLLDKADEIIRAYQYSSAGSKFLLALYVDSLNENLSKVCCLEKEYGNAQVEHMIAQNLEGDFGKYGFDVSTIGLLDNLILLSSKTNRTIGADNPEQKCEKWKDDSFGKLFWTDNKELPENLCDFRNSQEEKVNKIIDAFVSYFQVTQKEEAKNKRKSKYKITFAKKIYTNGRFDKLEWCAKDSLEDGNSNEHYLRIDEDKLDEHPKKNDDKAQECYWDADSIKPERLAELDANNIIIRFIELIGKDKFYAWLVQCEESIVENNVKNGSNKVKANEKEFCYSQKMIHTNWLEEQSIIEKVRGRKKNCYKLELENIGTIYISNDFNIKAIISNLEMLYKYFEDKNIFGFWIKCTQKQPVWIENVLIQTEYINIGDKAKYNNWIKKQYSEIFQETNSGGNRKQKSLSNDTAVNEIYFSMEHKAFTEIVKINNVAIPEYQRAYVWNEDNWNALFEQIVNHEQLFLGTIVLRKENDTFYIVDGQQRLTTLTGFYVGKNNDISSPNVLVDKSKANKVHEFIKNKSDDIKFENIYFDVITISEKADREYQYEVFSSINSAGKKLTEEEKIANYLFSKYGDKEPDSIRAVAHNLGFAKAFCECMCKKNCKYEDIYLTFKEIVEKQDDEYFNQLKKLSDIFYYIKGDKKQNIFGNGKYTIWLDMINMLEVTTADSLLLSWASRIISRRENEDKKYVDFEALTKRVCILYFLLYVMDRSGNAKKSANINFINCMELDSDNALVKKVVNSQADLQYWNNKNWERQKTTVAEKIWTEYVLSLSIYDIGQARIKRFILLILEYLLIDQLNYKEEDWINNVKSQEDMDIEHIFPASEKFWPKDNTNTISVARLNYLENVILLESDINKSVKDKMIKDKIKNQIEGKPKGYMQCKTFMAKMICDMADKNKKSIYDKEFADERMTIIKEKSIKNLTQMIDCVMTRYDCEMLEVENIYIKNNVVKSKKEVTKHESSRNRNIGIENLKKVIQYSTERAVCFMPQHIEKVADCRKYAIEKIVKEKGMDEKYKSTVADQITRRIGIKTKDFDQALIALWNGESNAYLDIILEKIGKISEEISEQLAYIIVKKEILL